VILFGYRWWEAPLDGKAGLRAEISGATLMEAMATLKQGGYLN